MRNPFMSALVLFLKQCLIGTLYAVSVLVPRKPRMAVLLYHSISDSDDFFAVSPNVFKRHVEEIRKRADIVPLSAVSAYMRGEPLMRDAVAITFDDGYRDFVLNALPVLAALDAPATVFVMGGEPMRAELGNEHSLLSSDDGALLKNPLVNVESHAATHRKLTRIAEHEARAELADSRSRIAEIFGVSAPVYLAYPKGAWNANVAEYAKDAGYDAAFTVGGRSVKHSDSPYAIPRIQVDSSTTSLEFSAKLTPAADWYHALWAFLKKKL